ncbi:sigma-70 family RNA polymerase sigma factor [Uniformispora flossi]|uniref:sigma-70 family RNA polymerase sigma factor n=1 Tax=Uniformispora flossi TaxID=3390723 RepID=UPI003C30AD3E
MGDEQPTEPWAEDATRVYVEYRGLLFSIVYNLLGGVADTEDVLQETWLSWARRHETGRDIENPRAYLVRIAVNEALARQSAIGRRRETYVGPWLPEPVAVPDHGKRYELLSVALLVVLETLTPLERVVFVLYDVFDYPTGEIAEILGRTPAAVRQLAHRARDHVQARRPRYRADPRVLRQLTERFAAAQLGGDVNALMEILAPDVTLWTDGGGKAPAAGQRPMHGRDKVARLFAAFAAAALHPDAHASVRTVNGDPTIVLVSGGRPFVALVLDLTPNGTQAAGIYAVSNPDKLLHLG